MCGWLHTLARLRLGSAREGLQMTSVGIIRSTSAFSRYHRCSQRMLRRAFLAKSRAIMGLFDPFQHLPADTRQRFLRIDLLDLKNPLRVMLFEFPAQLVA